MKNKKGFTFIELIVTIAIVAILAVIAIPLISRTLPNYQLKGTAKDVFSTLQKAKLEAIRQNADVAVTFTTGAYTVDGTVGTYQVFLDNGAGGGTEGNSIRDGSETIISSGSMPKGVSLITSGYTFTGTPGFNGQGLPLSLGSLQLRNNTRWYKITISIAGYINLQISSDGTTWSS